MQKQQGFFFGAFVGAVVLWGSGPAVRAEKCTLELVRWEPRSAEGEKAEKRMAFYPLSPQTFSMRSGAGMPSADVDPSFKEVVRKEPAKYLSAHPFRGVAKLGSKPYGFVLDQKTEKSQGYDRLYFDRNGNGDLTDEEPIDSPTKPPAGENASPGIVEYEFPRVDLPIDVDGKKLDYSFSFSDYSFITDRFQYLWARLSAAAYRRGEITLDGKTHQVALVDSNSNGRFDDVITLPEGGEEELTPTAGDLLVIDPETLTPPEIQQSPTLGARRQCLAKLAKVGDRFYEVKTTPLGDEMTWTPFSVSLGQVTSPHAPCSVELISDRGLVALSLEPEKPAAIPAGPWRLLSYNIQIKDWKEPEKKEEAAGKEKEKKEPSKPSLLSTLKKALTAAIPAPSVSPSRSNISMVMAQGTAKGKPMVVEPGRTTVLKFGPPYKVHAAVHSEPGVAHLALVMEGAAGETVSYLTVNGQRPPKPELRITDPKGEEVAKGNFEYG